jgi:excisionase family DNA binding protein
MPQILKSAPDGRVRLARCYTVGETAVLLQLSHSSVLRMIARGELAAYRLPNRRGDRRVVHQALISFVRRNPGFRFVLENLSGFHPGDEFPESAEQPPPPTRIVRFGPPRSSHRPRRAFGGRIPLAAHYSASEIGYLIGRSRQSVVKLLNARILVGMRIPSIGITPWAWRVSHGSLVAFLRLHPEFAFASGRIEGFQSGSELPADLGEVRYRMPSTE